MKIFITHAWYGCESGCCGHIIEVDSDGFVTEQGGFVFSHAEDKASVKKWAEEIISDYLGPEHVKDLDWDRCQIWDWDDKEVK